MFIVVWGVDGDVVGCGTHLTCGGYNCVSRYRDCWSDGECVVAVSVMNDDIQVWSGHGDWFGKGRVRWCSCHPGGLWRWGDIMHCEEGNVVRYCDADEGDGDWFCDGGDCIR